MKSKIIYTIAIATIVLSRWLGRDSEIAEKLYFKGIYQCIRVVYDYTLGWLPIPMMYIFILTLLFLIYKFVRNQKGQSWMNVLQATIKSLLNLAAILAIMFYWLWGFNYNRVSIEKHLGFENAVIDSTEFAQTLLTTITTMNELRSEIDMDTQVEMIQQNKQSFETACRNSLATILQGMNYPTNGRIRIRRLFPKGSLLRISTAGVYWPFVLEGHIDPGLHPITWPFTMTHEMGHGFGFTDEGTCNFLGWLGCVSNEDKFIQYSGWMGYYRYLLINFRRNYPDSYKEIYDGIPKTILADIKSIEEYANRYPDIFPKARNAFYDNYLKTHGVQGGLANYSKIIKLVHAWSASEADENQN